jgi:hypothetical protein
METRGALNDHQKEMLPAFCQAMSEGLAELVRQMSPTITSRDVAESPLLTIGATPSRGITYHPHPAPLPLGEEE